MRAMRPNNSAIRHEAVHNFKDIAVGYQRYHVTERNRLFIIMVTRYGLQRKCHIMFYYRHVPYFLLKPFFRRLAVNRHTVRFSTENVLCRFHKVPSKVNKSKSDYHNRN